MKSNAFEDYIRSPLVLTVLCVLITLALVATHNLTQPIIDVRAVEEAKLARQAVLPAADDFEEVSVELPANGIDCYKATNGAGYVITGSAKGYGGLMKVMVGIDNDGKITGITVLDHSETAGLGSRTALPAYTGQYAGKDSSLSGIEHIAGSTISSKAVDKAVGVAYAIYESVK